MSVFSPEEERQLAEAAALIIPASPEHGVPGADDPAILRGLLEDAAGKADAVRAALSALALTNGDAAVRGAELQATAPDAAQLLQSLVAHAYYRDPRVLKALGMDARPPFPSGQTIPQGDWSLLQPVHEMPAIWRKDTPGMSTGAIGTKRVAHDPSPTPREGVYR
ncbi:MAG: hypothetical protein AAF439_11155 [Pseudomonadota bacterium]